jgi:predicted RNase H-like HicB family nuclease
MTLDQYMKLPWRTTVEIEADGDQPCFVACNPDFALCIGTGRTADEALADLDTARQAILDVMIRHNDPIPVPDGDSLACLETRMTTSACTAGLFSSPIVFSLPGMAVLTPDTSVADQLGSACADLVPA